MVVTYPAPTFISDNWWATKAVEDNSRFFSKSVQVRCDRSSTHDAKMQMRCRCTFFATPCNRHRHCNASFATGPFQQIPIDWDDCIVFKWGAPRSCPETALKLLWNCSETALISGMDQCPVYEMVARGHWLIDKSRNCLTAFRVTYLWHELVDSCIVITSIESKLIKSGNSFEWNAAGLESSEWTRGNHLGRHFELAKEWKKNGNLCGYIRACIAAVYLFLYNPALNQMKWYHNDYNNPTKQCTIPILCCWLLKSYCASMAEATDRHSNVFEHHFLKWKIGIA